MNKFLRFYNQNRKKIWRFVIMIFFLYIFLILLLHIITKNIENNLEDEKNNSNLIKNIETNSIKINSDKSDLTQETLSATDLKEESKIIDNFVSYCNEKDYQSAYNLLSEDCKEEIFKTVEIFKTAYYDDVFNGQKKSCEIENWINSIYKVQFTEDLLSSGKSDSKEKKQDYITVVEEDGKKKLNINSYIGYKNINKSNNDENIEMDVIGKNVYMDYEEYTIKVTNNNDVSIVLEDNDNSYSIFLKDSNDKIYPYYNNELVDELLTVSAGGQTQTIKIKFYNSYVSTRKIKSVNFNYIKLNTRDSIKYIKYNINI